MVVQMTPLMRVITITRDNLMSASSAPVSGSVDDVVVIPLDASRDSDDHWILKVPPQNAADRAIARLKALRDEGVVCLGDDAIENLCRAAVEPSEIVTAKLARHRVENGWLYTLSTRVFTPMVNVAYTNDRTLEDATYDADPTSSTNAASTQLALPTSGGTESVLQYSGTEQLLLTAADRNAKLVLTQNGQNVGERIVERPITLVVTRRDGDRTMENGLELTAVDGNSRLSSAFDQLGVLPASIFPARFREAGRHARVQPSTLMGMSALERRKFTRDAAKLLSAEAWAAAANDRQREHRNARVRAMNSMTVPAEIIVGFIDDDRAHGQRRFDSAVRALLMRMNVSVRPFGEGSRNAVVAEEVVSALFDASLITAEGKDILIGRKNVAAAMTSSHLNPTLPDLRAAFVTRQLTHNDRAHNAPIRQKLGKSSLVIADRHGLVTELALRGYTTKLRDATSTNATSRLDQVRNAFRSAPLWQELLTENWDVRNVDTDDAIDALAASAAADGPESNSDALLLGVLGLFAMTTTGYLLAPGGSSEAVAKGKVDRGALGSIVRGMLRHHWGIELLADAVKRSRADLPLRMWDEETEELLEVPVKDKAKFNAFLRRRLWQEDSPEVVETPDGLQKSALDQLCESVASARNSMQVLLDVRKEHGLTERLPYADVAATLQTLSRVRDVLVTVSLPSDDQVAL